MPIKTITVIFILSIVATLLFGINIGKKLGKSQYSQPSPPAAASPKVTRPATVSPAFAPNPTAETKLPSSSQSSSTYSDKSCGFSITYQGSYMDQKSRNNSSTIITDPDNPEAAIVTTCQSEIPKPPLPPEKIEDIVLDGVPARLYHDASSKDGSPRDEVIVTHPVLNHEIIIAGFGPAFDQAVSSFKFL